MRNDQWIETTLRDVRRARRSLEAAAVVQTVLLAGAMTVFVWYLHFIQL